MRLIAMVPALLAVLVGATPAHAWTRPVDGPVLEPFSLGDDAYAAGYHRGVDLAAPAGSPIRAPASGTITFAGTVPGGGRTLTISTPDGYAVTLVHLGSIDVARGAAVAEGSIVATVGPSGAVEHPEPYVHFGVRVAADAEGYLDPMSFLASAVAAPVPPEEPEGGEAAPADAPEPSAPGRTSRATEAPTETAVAKTESPAQANDGRKRRAWTAATEAPRVEPAASLQPNRRGADWIGAVARRRERAAARALVEARADGLVSEGCRCEPRERRVDTDLASSLTRAARGRHDAPVFPLIALAGGALALAALLRRRPVAREADAGRKSLPRAAVRMSAPSFPHGVAGSRAAVAASTSVPSAPPQPSPRTPCLPVAVANQRPRPRGVPSGVARLRRDAAPRRGGLRSAAGARHRPPHLADEATVRALRRGLPRELPLEARNLELLCVLRSLEPLGVEREVPDPLPSFCDPSHCA